MSDINKVSVAFWGTDSVVDLPEVAEGTTVRDAVVAALECSNRSADDARNLEFVVDGETVSGDTVVTQGMEIVATTHVSNG